MTALAKERMRCKETLARVTLTLASGTKAWKGGRAVFNTAGKVVPATSSPLVVCAGIFAENMDATSADKQVSVDLETEVVAEWFANATSTDAVAATDIGKLGFMMDDQTVTITPADRAIAGRIWKVDSVRGVLVEKLLRIRNEQLLTPADAVYTANDWAPTAAQIVHDAVYDVPATGAASTITLPAASPDGTRVYFAADGTKNGHTVTYRDATGPVSLTTALTASKRHGVLAVKRDGKWTAIAYVSP
jgi:hypothetical protein